MSLLESMKRIQTRIIGQQELMTNENAAISLSVTTLDGFLFDISYKGKCAQVSKGEFKEALRRAKRGRELVETRRGIERSPIFRFGLFKCKG